MISADRVTKAYGSMKPTELAAIAFQFLADTNEKEMTSVFRAVPWGTYRAPDYDFRRRYDYLFNMAAFWAIEYWKSYAMLLAALAQSTKSLEENDFEASDNSLDAVANHRVRLVSLIQAGEAVCAELGVDPGVLWKFAGAERLPIDGIASPGWLADYTEYLMAIATGETASGEAPGLLRAPA
jgi:hypothetical protein